MTETVDGIENLRKQRRTELFQLDWQHLLHPYHRIRKEFKVTQCHQCLRDLQAWEEDGQKLDEWEQEYWQQLIKNYEISREPKNCRLFMEVDYTISQLIGSEPFNENSFKSWFGTWVTEGEHVHRQYWLCVYHYLGAILALIWSDYSPYREREPHTRNREYYDLAVELHNTAQPNDPWDAPFLGAPRDFILNRAKETLRGDPLTIFTLWTAGLQQQQIADKIGKSIGFVNTRLRRVREGGLGGWYEEYFKGKGNKAGHGEPDLIEDGIPINLKCVGDKATTRIKRKKLGPELDYAKTHNTKLRIRVYNIVHDKTQEQEFTPLDVPIEVQFIW